MPQDELASMFRVIGYDLRVWPAFAGTKHSTVQVSLDPSVWHSARELSSDLFCEAFGVERIGDVSNGLNLAISPPRRPSPTGFITVAFDAPQQTVARICNSFGLQHSLESNSEVLSTGGFVCLGYDVVDIWTQRTALYPSEIFQATLNSSGLELNELGLFPTQASAARGCLLADSRNPDSSPFQPVGIWIASAEIGVGSAQRA